MFDLLWPPIPSLPEKAIKPSICSVLFLIFLQHHLRDCANKTHIFVSTKNTNFVFPVFPHLWWMKRGVHQSIRGIPWQSEGSNSATPPPLCLTYTSANDNTTRHASQLPLPPLLLPLSLLHLWHIQCHHMPPLSCGITRHAALLGWKIPWRRLTGIKSCPTTSLAGGGGATDVVVDGEGIREEEVGGDGLVLGTRNDCCCTVDLQKKRRLPLPWLFNP